MILIELIQQQPKPNLNSQLMYQFHQSQAKFKFPIISMNIIFINMQEDCPLKPVPQIEVGQQYSFQQSEESHDALISKHLIPPPLMLLPKPINNKPRSLLPMIPLPTFVGIIPKFQPLQHSLDQMKHENDLFYNWIGEAFDYSAIVYRKYQESSYIKIDTDQNWNIWACDMSKISNQKDQHEKQQQIKQFYTPKDNQDQTLVFQSRFQSGNLSLASKVTENQYNLLLQNDINTNGYSQWFFFKVSNTIKDKKVRFNILNLYKHNNLYKGGMKIIIYSTKQSGQKNISWHRGGQNIQYYQNGYSKSSTQFKPYFTLSWEYVFAHSEDEVYFAYNYPFTYTNLENQIQKIESDPFTRQICQRQLLCKTPAGNRVDILTITESHPFQQLEKSYVVITARVHPGQTVSSYVCNGILEFLLSSNEMAKKLRQNFIFKIIPMLNPDGVIHGNYRSNISGYDLNRKWENPSKNYHCQIYHLKMYIKHLQQIGQVVLFCDLHGHSMKKNAFIYGCHDVNDPVSGKLFPMLISKLFRGFSFRDCSFLIKEQRQGTSRSVLAKDLQHQNIYTLESSFCGPEYENIHFTVRHFEQLGEKFCEALLIAFKDRIKQMQIQAAMKEKSFFPNHDSSMDSIMDYESMIDLNQLTEQDFEDRVNSENSQGSEPQNQYRTLLEQRTIKKYLLIKSQRPSTSGNNFRGLRKSYSKDLNMRMLRKSEFNIHKSISPVKRKELYQTPKVQKIKFSSPQKHQKKERHNIELKLFSPDQFATIGIDKRKYKSVSRFGNRQQIVAGIQKRQQSLGVKTSKPSFKLTLTKNFQFKEEDSEKQTIPIFKNSQLKNFVSLGSREQASKKQRRSNQFVIRKNNKVQYADESNSTNLFKSVLSSLRKDRK